ncbi:hypothetical protein DPMN_065026 [Dreissena polymorpha]|uniref:Uncharacterized protein n=2 Tax=Dreissena polymorpha TaxID=45954 RepID=A0A9D4HJZ4_DREPO|nr:hypothetical protein DPMN_065026 [Dreissena polymorpha]
MKTLALMCLFVAVAVAVLPKKRGPNIHKVQNVRDIPKMKTLQRRDNAGDDINGNDADDLPEWLGVALDMYTLDGVDTVERVVDNQSWQKACV